jgi:hypothetical protein
MCGVSVIFQNFFYYLAKIVILLKPFIMGFFFEKFCVNIMKIYEYIFAQYKRSFHDKHSTLSPLTNPL